MYYYKHMLDETLLGLESRSVPFVDPDEHTLAISAQEYQTLLAALCPSEGEPEA